MSDQITKLRDDAHFLAGSVAMAAARTTTAKRALDDALLEENRLTQKLREAISALAAAAAQSEGADP